MSIPRRPVAILNPTAAGHDRALELLEQARRRAGWPEPTVLATTAEDFGSGQARAALEMGADLVLVGGGDGTVRAVAEQLRGREVTVGIIPLGTANVYARNLGLSPRRLDQAVERAVFGTARRLDLGVARWRTEADPTTSHEHLFLVLAGLGHDAETVAATRPGLKQRLGWAAYFESGLRHLGRTPVSMQVSRDGAASELELWSYLVGNAPRIPLGIEVFPRVRLDDGLLDAMEVHVTRPHQWSRVAVAALRRRAEAPVLVHHSITSVRLTPHEPTLLQLDGDVFGPVVEVEITVDPQSLLVNLPPTTDEEGQP